MPLVKLYVEGKLELELLNPILRGLPVLQLGGSKNALKPRAWADRRERGLSVGYLRDRDFDFDPPEDSTMPTVDSKDGLVPVGWRWCRHETENYLIEPDLVSEAMAWPAGDVENAIRHSAETIRDYQAARWTIGVVRRVLPPHYELNTRPDDLNEFVLPSELGAVTTQKWASNNIARHRARIVNETSPQAVITSFEVFRTRFNDGFIANVASVLLWFSGKDVLAGMADWLYVRAGLHPGDFRALMRDWVIANPKHALELLPEWNNLLAALKESREYN